MQIIIKRSEIVKHNPYESCLEWFDSMAKKHSIEIPGKLGLLWLFVNPETKQHAAWMRNKGVLPGLNLAHTNLSGADLSEADLYSANLFHTNLKNANLSYTFLSSANLVTANLSGANLCHADLSGANLFGANLKGANLETTNLSGADLSGAYRNSNDPEIPGWKVVKGNLERA